MIVLLSLGSGCSSPVEEETCEPFTSLNFHQAWADRPSEGTVLVCGSRTLSAGVGEPVLLESIDSGKSWIEIGPDPRGHGAWPFRALTRLEDGSILTASGNARSGDLKNGLGEIWERDSQGQWKFLEQIKGVPKEIAWFKKGNDVVVAVAGNIEGPRARIWVREGKNAFTVVDIPTELRNCSLSSMTAFKDSVAISLDNQNQLFRLDKVKELWRLKALSETAADLPATGTYRLRAREGVLAMVGQKAEIYRFESGDPRFDKLSIPEGSLDAWCHCILPGGQSFCVLGRGTSECCSLIIPSGINRTSVPTRSVVFKNQGTINYTCTDCVPIGQTEILAFAEKQGGIFRFDGQNWGGYQPTKALSKSAYLASTEYKRYGQVARPRFERVWVP